MVFFVVLFHFASVRSELVYHGQGRAPYAHSSVSFAPEKGASAQRLKQEYTEVFVSAVVDKLLGVRFGLLHDLYMRSCITWSLFVTCFFAL